jgi:hypothetical protein
VLLLVRRQAEDASRQTVYFLWVSMHKGETEVGVQSEEDGMVHVHLLSDCLPLEGFMY